jgi:ubiquinone/menaquinone biosynthesis C-methylase UbiE
MSYLVVAPSERTAMGPQPFNESLDRYVMGQTSEEYQRLRQQAKVWEASTVQILQRIGLQEGMSCLDVGCGPGEAMRLMGEKVGESGHVTGLDIDGKLGHEMLEVLKATVKSNFAFIEDDVEAIDEVAGQPFDVTFARIVLLHAKDPISVLRKLYSWTKPGGYLVVQDYDFRASDAYPKPDAYIEYEKVLFEVLHKSGRDSRIGHKLPTYFVDAGIGPPDGTDVAGHLMSLEQASGMIKAVYRSMLPRALQLGVTTEARSQAFFEQMDEVSRERHYSFLWPLLIGAWKRKPT